ncbi:hypothetical protein Pla22_37200 [Rubripirellula amarantea]|uniref:Uncharacterized protein n=1 Tax=Rubripirellula amarantea TaxID=2527999 RepID=A0A5C5WJM4_9BACT|nr:hypothetical protein [Rubripirellula amarantea]TWT50976.1 hypothetical protein Pla22_37200 [Rubripirellula amarantea]
MNDEEFISAVHRHRDEPAACLEFQPRIEKLVDFEHCRQICDFVHGFEAKWERHVATSSLHTTLPRERGVYMFVWRPPFEFAFDPNGKECVNYILYVGKAGIENGTTDTIRDRYYSEYRKFVNCDPNTLWDRTADTTREQRLRKFLNLRPLEFWMLPLPLIDAKEIELVERQLIRVFNPPINRTHGTRLRPSKPEPAF